MDLIPRFSFICSSSVFLCFLLFRLSTANYISDDVFGSHASAGRSLLQTKKSCAVNFEFLDYSILIDVCKGPRYCANQCCPAFKKFACPYAKEINDLTTDCASIMFSYINLYGKYPPGLFASECREGKEGLDCTNVTSMDYTASPNGSHLTRGPCEGKEGLDCTNVTSIDYTASPSGSHLTRSPCEGKEGLDCTNVTSIDYTASPNGSHLTRSPFTLLLGIILGFMGFQLI